MNENLILTNTVNEIIKKLSKENLSVQQEEVRQEEVRQDTDTTQSDEASEEPERGENQFEREHILKKESHDEMIKDSSKTPRQEKEAKLILRKQRRMR